MSSNAEEIARLKAILNAGASSTALDGLSTTFDLDQVRRRLAELEREDQPAARPRVSQIDLSGF